MSKAKPDCPSCGSNRSVYAEGDRGYWCRLCNAAFDGDPGEGGDYSSSDPSWRLQRAEERAKRKRLEQAKRAAMPPGFRRARI
jgi:transposase-like protein